jgi:transposase
MDLREQRGLVIAATAKLKRQGERWIVPSQSGHGIYAVSLDSADTRCSCPDWETRREKCKHIFAAMFVVRREVYPDGKTVTETLAITSETRVTYPQQWSAYNTAQTNEKHKFQSLLADLCRGLETPQVRKNGRPTLPMSDALFSAIYKVYSTVSARRFMSDLRDAQARGYIAKTPHFNSVLNYLDKPELTPILRNLITKSAMPLQSVETDFAVDSSGFMTSRFVRWFDVKYGKEQTKREWVKVHLMCGVKTNVVTAVEIGDKHASDLKFFPPLVEATARHFTVSEVSADKAYGGRVTTDAVHAVGGTPFISFRGNATGKVGGTYEQMFHYFMFRKQEFLSHYHKRSNVESTFSMMKRKFGDSLRSKTDVAMVNESLCKILCHNLVVLIHEMLELGIDPVFWPQSPSSVV